MSEYSLEFCRKHDFMMPGDFSINLGFLKLKEGPQKYLCCEGWGFVGIRKGAGKCLLIFPDGKIADFLSLE